jgi:hypothetical protein
MGNQAFFVDPEAVFDDRVIAEKNGGRGGAFHAVD